MKSHIYFEQTPVGSVDDGGVGLWGWGVGMELVSVGVVTFYHIRVSGAGSAQPGASPPPFPHANRTSPHASRLSLSD